MRADTSSKLGISLDRVPALIERFRGLPSAPLIGSTCWADRRLGPPGERPSAIASLKLAVGADHLNALRLLVIVAKAIPVYAHLTLLRPVFEASVQVRWLIADGISPEERVGRAVSCAISDLGWLSEAEKDLRMKGWTPSPTYPGASVRSASVRQDALDRGLPVHGVPPTTTLMRDFALGGPGEDAMLFRYTSGVLHVQVWASTIGASEPELTPLGLVQGMEADEDVAVGFTAAAIRHFERALDDYERYLSPRP